MDEGISPLEFMLKVMRQDPTHEDPKVQIARESLQFEAAKAAAPYMHPRLAAVEHSGPDGGQMTALVPIFSLTLTADEDDQEAA